MSDSGSDKSEGAPPTLPRPSTTPFHTVREALLQLLHPVPLIALLIIGSVFVLIAVPGLRNDVISQMSRPPFARGLITYLFAVVTIGTAVVLVVSVLMGGSGTDKEQFQHAKDILGLLLGVFGTIVGYYFGTERLGSELGGATYLAVSSLVAAELPLIGGEATTLQAQVSGGAPPYRFVLFLRQGGTPVVEGEVEEDGRVVARLPSPMVASDSNLDVQLLIRDANSASVRTITTLPIKPP